MGVMERRRREREVRRELAIDAAMSIYEAEGYHAITMEKIAERAELSRAALYLYFKNKEEILVSAIVAHTDYFAQVLKEVYDNRESIKGELLEKLWECFQKFYEKDPAAFTAWHKAMRESSRNCLLPKRGLVMISTAPYSSALRVLCAPSSARLEQITTGIGCWVMIFMA